MIFYSLSPILIWWLCSFTLKTFISSSFDPCLSMYLFSYFFSFVSSGKQATHKNPEEYAEPNMERGAGVSWHHSSRHDHQNAQVGAPLWFSHWPEIRCIPQTAKWPVYDVGDNNSCLQFSSELPAALYESQWAFPGHSLFQPSNASPSSHMQPLLYLLGVRCGGSLCTLLPAMLSIWTDWGRA